VTQDTGLLRERPAAPAARRLDDLGSHGDRDLGRGLRADVEAQGRMNPRQPLRLDALGGELFERGPDPAAAADHADIGGLGAAPRERPQTHVIVTVSACHEDDARPPADGDPRQRVREIGYDDAVGVGEPFPARELRPIVQHRDPEVEQAPDGGERLGHVAGADDHELERRGPALHVQLDVARDPPAAHRVRGIEQLPRLRGGGGVPEIPVMMAAVPGEPAADERRVGGGHDHRRRALLARRDRVSREGERVRDVEPPAHGQPRGATSRW
jgi:hypothetical protein